MKNESKESDEWQNQSELQAGYYGYEITSTKLFLLMLLAESVRLRVPSPVGPTRHSNEVYFDNWITGCYTPESWLVCLHMAARPRKAGVEI